MGNSKLASGCQSRSTGAAESAQANGILSRVPGDCIAAALATLPAPALDGATQHEVVIDARHAGTVRLYIKRMRARHGKHSHYYWSAYRAEPVPPVSE